MHQPTKLVNSELVENEKRWTYTLAITFNYLPIIYITITDYYQQKPGREKITNELILEIIEKKLDKEKLESRSDYVGSRQIFRWEPVYQGKKYRLIFWFKDKETSHLWIRNCYPID